MSLAETPPEVARKTMTVEEFLALPDDGIHRELIRGEVREEVMTVRNGFHDAVEEMSYRNRFHASAESEIVIELGIWSRSQPVSPGRVVSGEAGFRLKGTKDSLVGIDVAFVSTELLNMTGPKQAIFDGPPVLAVEVLSPYDVLDEILDKIELYLESGVAIVWEVDPRLRTVRVHRPGREPTMFSASQELNAEPELPGFRVLVARLFGA